MELALGPGELVRAQLPAVLTWVGLVVDCFLVPWVRIGETAATLYNQWWPVLSLHVCRTLCHFLPASQSQILPHRTLVA